MLEVHRELVPVMVEVYRLNPEKDDIDEVGNSETVRDGYIVTLHPVSNGVGFYGDGVSCEIGEAGIGYFLDDLEMWDEIKRYLPEVEMDDWGRVLLLFEHRTSKNDGYYWGGVEYDTHICVLGKIDTYKLESALEI